MSVRRIAKLADLSPSAVSLALLNSPKIPEATKRRVLKIAKRIGYRRDAKVTELMSRVRRAQHPKSEACLGVISFYEDARPWEKSRHFAQIFAGMNERADALGYRLEPLWLRAPGMTYRRLRSILDARGIEGLVCFGSPDFDQEFPAEFDHYAIVTQGLSIKTPLHRVVSHVYSDMWRALNHLHSLGYRRPGLVIGRYEETRSAHGYLCAYLGWLQLMLGTPSALPTLQLDEIEEEPLFAWLERHRPDVLIFVHQHHTLLKFESLLRRRDLRMPKDIGVAAISQNLAGTKFSGLQENQHLIGAWSVELVVSRIMCRDFGIPTHPRIEMVERTWVDGASLRPPPPA
jgi:DNA-binding LacI/PurR family transcriptional regulator